MSTGPLRRVIGTFGLLLLAPTAYLLLAGDITVVEAGVRAAATLVATLVVGRIAAFWLKSLANDFENEAEQDEQEDAPEPAARRRGEQDQGST